MKKSLPIWVAPSVSLLLGFALGLLVARVDGGNDSWYGLLLYGGDAAAARSLLSNVLTGIVSITTLTLTLTVVTLQLASSQYSPRLMKRYLRDRSIQVVVGFFFFVFAFTLPVLFNVRSAGENGEGGYVPDVAMSTVILLAVLMLIGLIYFVFHVTRSVRVENILEQIAEGAHRVLDRHPQLGSGDDVPDIADDAVRVAARGSGFLTSIDVDEVRAGLRDGDRLWLDGGVGDYVIEGTSVAWYDGELDAERVAEIVHDATSLDSERDESTEFAFALRQIVDVGVRALSPGVNDPTTAVVSVNVATRALIGAIDVRSANDDPDGGVQVYLPRPTWVELVFTTFDQFATYGSGDAQVARSMARSLRRIMAHAPESAPTERLREVVDAVRRHVDDAVLAPSEEEATLEALDEIAALIDGHPKPNDPRVREHRHAI